MKYKLCLDVVRFSPVYDKLLIELTVHVVLGEH